jgi:hypothetical protein
VNKHLKNIILVLAVLAFIAIQIAGELYCSGYFIYLEKLNSCCPSDEEPADVPDCCGKDTCIMKRKDALYVTTRKTVLEMQPVVASVPVAVSVLPLPEISECAGADIPLSFHITPRDYLSKLRVLII